jgi:hypothetical protein
MRKARSNCEKFAEVCLILRSEQNFGKKSGKQEKVCKSELEDKKIIKEKNARGSDRKF